MYEHHSERLLPRRQFAWRLARSALGALILVAVSLLVGMVGYKTLEPKVLTWTDAFLNAAMILSGMGPVTTDHSSDAGKIFAGCFALFSGLVLVGATALILAPVLHRFLHRFHFEEERDGRND